jgi:RNA polymerase sigma-70 factor, ECF subfamily
MSAERALRAVPARPTDAEVVRAAQGAELWAFEALYRRTAPIAYGVVRRLLGTDEDVDDVVQDAFIAAFDKIGSLREADAFAVGKVSRVIRKRRVLAAVGLRSRQSVADVDQMLAPSAPPDVALELERLYQVVVALPTNDRIALVLRRVEGSTLEEIAEVTGCSLATVKRRLARADAALAEHGGER